MSFSKTRWVIFQALKSFGERVGGASRIRKSLDLGFGLVIEVERPFWQSILGFVSLYLIGEGRGKIQ